MSREDCTLSCVVCGRLCHGTRFGRQSHRFDCCGIVAAHAPARDRRAEPVWRRIDDPMRAGWLTGPSTTAPRRQHRMGNIGEPNRTVEAPEPVPDEVPAEQPVTTPATPAPATVPEPEPVGA